jgi:hypothetical protein
VQRLRGEIRSGLGKREMIRVNCSFCGKSQNEVATVRWSRRGSHLQRVRAAARCLPRRNAGTTPASARAEYAQRPVEAYPAQDHEVAIGRREWR